MNLQNNVPETNITFQDKIHVLYTCWLCHLLDHNKVRGVVAGGKGGHSPPNFFEIVGTSEILMLCWRFVDFVIGKDRGIEFYWKIIELGLPPCSTGVTAPLNTVNDLLSYSRVSEK